MAVGRLKNKCSQKHLRWPMLVLELELIDLDTNKLSTFGFLEKKLYF